MTQPFDGPRGRANGYPQGIDCVWRAVDKRGLVGAVITAGEGPIPVRTLQQVFLPEVEARLLELPVVSEGHLHVEVPWPGRFIGYVYDWAGDAVQRHTYRWWPYRQVRLQPGISGVGAAIDRRVGAAGS